MSHDHNHHHNGNIKVAFFLNASFTVLEIIGGLLINSVAILSDALHDLGDSFSLGLAWYLENFGDKDSDEAFTYGYRRFSLLGALINIIILVVGSLFILSEAIPRLLSPESFSAPGMILFAIVGIAVNGIATFRLKGEDSLNAQVVSWHLLEDVLGWVAVLIVGVISLFVNLPILDPLLSIGLTGFILFNVVKKLNQTVNIFLQGVPDDIPFNELSESLLSLDCVESLHHMHVWSLDGEHNVFTAHLIVSGKPSPELVLKTKTSAKAVLDTYDFSHITLELEYGKDDCSLVASV